MPKKKKVKSSGRFGARYGRKVRAEIAEIESLQRKKQHCVFCGWVAKRVSKGIWHCKKCNKKFIGHVYFLKKED